MRRDRIIRWSTAAAVIGVAAVAAVASYEHACAVVRAHGETGWTARLVRLTVDGLIYASSMLMLDSARRKVPVPALARWLLGPGIAANLAANVPHSLGHGAAGAVVAVWPAVALVGSYELLMVIIRGAYLPADVPGVVGVPDRHLMLVRCRCRPRRCSPLSSRPVAFPRCALSARGFMSGSRVRIRYGRSWPHSPAAAQAGRWDVRRHARALHRGTSGRFVTRHDALTETARKRTAWAAARSKSGTPGPSRKGDLYSTWSRAPSVESRECRQSGALLVARRLTRVWGWRFLCPEFRRTEGSSG